MNFIFVVYFFAGIIQDFLFTLSLRLVNREQPIKAASVAFMDNLVGTYLAIRFKLKEKKNIN
jgi:hypothetical protein